MKGFLPVVMIKGSPEHPRYALGNTRDEVWTGSEWTEDHGKARLYAEFGSIATDSQHLLIRASDWEMIDYFTVPIDIEVYSKSPVSRERLIERLQAALSFSVNYPKSGTGPDGALVISSIDWSKLVREEPAT